MGTPCAQAEQQAGEAGEGLAVGSRAREPWMIKGIPGPEAEEGRLSQGSQGLGHLELTFIEHFRAISL